MQVFCPRITQELDILRDADGLNLDGGLEVVGNVLDAVAQDHVGHSDDDDRYGQGVRRDGRPDEADQKDGGEDNE